MSLNSIKAKLNLAFYLFTAIIVAIIFSFYLFEYSDNRIERMNQKLSQIKQNVNKIRLLEKDFLLYETINVDFYHFGKSPYLVQHRQFEDLIREDLKRLRESRWFGNQQIKKQIDTITIKIGFYEQYYADLIQTITRRGFKDYGLEGEMRQYIHRLENEKLFVSEILTIRRHEKDFINRKEEIYIGKLSVAVEDLRNKVQTKPLPAEQKRVFLKSLDLYKQTFLKLVSTEQSLGLKRNEGLKGKLSLLASEIDQKIMDVTEKISRNAARLQRILIIIFTAVCIIFLSIIVFLSRLVTRKLGKPIRELSNSIYEVISSDFDHSSRIKRFYSNDEIGKLSRDFCYLYEKVKEHNEKILRQKEEIAAQRDMLDLQNKEILEVQQQLEEANEELMALNTNLENLVEQRTKSLVRTNEELDMFLYRASHDLKGPLYRLKGLAQLGNLESTTDSSHHYFEKLEQNVEEMDGLLDKLLMINVIHQEVRRYRKIRFQEIWHDSQQSLSRLLSKNDVILHTHFSYDKVFFSDRHLLNLVVQNLLENAILFRTQDPEKQAEIHLYFRSENNHFEIEIADNGIGIPAELLPKVSQMFFRASEYSKGNGLGLYIVEKALEELDGKLEIESEEGHYTIVRARIPHRNKKKKIIDYFAY